MTPCALCRKPKPESEYGLRYGKRKKTCERCCEKARARYHDGTEASTPRLFTFPVVIDTYDLTDEEAHAVDMAAGQSLSYRRFKRRHKKRKWPGPTGDQVIDALGGTVRRRCELLLAASLRAREMIVAQGLDPREFFSSHRTLLPR